MTRGRLVHHDYGWANAQAELAEGIHPGVVAARLGEPEDYVLEVAGDRGWPVTWVGPSAVQILDAMERGCRS
jgi:hypothetical protein